MSGNNRADKTAKYTAEMGPHIQFINLLLSLYDVIDNQENILQSEKDELI